MFARVDTGVRWLRVTRVGAGFGDGLALGRAVLDVRDLAMGCGSGLSAAPELALAPPKAPQVARRALVFSAHRRAPDTHSNACFPAEVEWKVAGRATKNKPVRLSVNELPLDPVRARHYLYLPTQLRARRAALDTATAHGECRSTNGPSFRGNSRPRSGYVRRRTIVARRRI